MQYKLEAAPEIHNATVVAFVLPKMLKHSKKSYNKALTRIPKEVVKLSLTHSHELQETDHVKNYKVNTSTTKTECNFQYESMAKALLKVGGWSEIVKMGYIICEQPLPIML